MKKVLLIALAAIAALASCTREELNGPANIADGQKVLKTFTVSLPDASVRTTLDGTKVNWEVGDTIFFNDGTTTQKIGVPAAGPSFEFSVEVAAAAENFVALYSKTEVNPTFSGDQITVKTSLAQNRLGLTLGDADVLVAKSSNGTLAFKHAFGILSFELNKPVTRIMVRTPDHTGIGSGEDGAFPKVQAMAGDTPVFTPNCFTDAILLKTEGVSGKIYFAVPIPCELAIGTEVWMQDGEGNVYCRKTTKMNELEPGLVLNMGQASALMVEENLVSARFEKVTAMPSSEDLLSKPFIMCATADDKTYEFTGCVSGIGQYREITEDVVATNIKLNLDNLFHALHFTASEGGTYNIDIQGMYLTLNSNANKLNKANPLPEGDDIDKGRWTVAYDAEKSMVITSKAFNTRTIRWNNTVDQYRFVTYTSGQTNVDLYALKTVVLGAKEITLSETSVDAPGNAAVSTVDLILSNIDESDIQVSSNNAEITAVVEGGKVKISCSENGPETRNATITVSSKTDPGVEAKEIAVVQRIYVEGLAELNGAMTGTRTKYTVKVSDAVISYATSDKKKAYIEDAAGADYIFLTAVSNELVTGNKINQYLDVDAYLYNAIPEIVDLGFRQATVTAGDAPAGVEVTLAQLESGYSNYLNRKVLVKGVTVTDPITLAADRGGVVSKDEKTFAIYSQMSTITIEAGAVINFVGFPTLYNSTTKQIGLYDQQHIEFVSRVTNITFPAEKTMGKDDTWTLDATTNSTGAITYESSDPTVVSIADGVATALKAGDATITATVAADGLFPEKSVGCVVTVSEGPVASLQYTLDGTVTGGNNGFATHSDITQDKIDWKVMGNTTQSPWRIGGKSLTNEKRTVYSATAIAANITKIEITHGTADGVTVNSLTVSVHSTADDAASGENAIATFTPTFAANDTAVVEKADETSWAGKFYRIVYDVTISATSNKYVQLKKIQLFGFAAE